jgi:hypothetical protein
MLPHSLPPSTDLVTGVGYELVTVPMYYISHMLPFGDTLIIYGQEVENDTIGRGAVKIVSRNI